MMTERGVRLPLEAVASRADATTAAAGTAFVSSRTNSGKTGGHSLNGQTANRLLVSMTAVIMTALSASSVLAETSEERSACIGDAFRVCWAAIPNRDDVFHCLLDKRSELSIACRMVMDQYRRPRHRIVRT